MIKRIAVTGTRFGATQLQKSRLLTSLRTDEFTHWHHGLCIGVDCETHALMREWFPEVGIVGHPPVKTEHMGEVECDELRQPKSHFARNRDLVDETGGLIAIPCQAEWQSRGGTWYTHDYALKRGKPVMIIWPDGSVTVK